MTTTSNVISLAGATLLLALAGCAGQSDRQAFLRDAIQGDLGEIKLGTLVAQKAEREDIRDFGRMLVDDHQQAMRRANQTAQSLGVTIPTQPSDEAQDEYASLEKKSGSAFDRAFLDHAIEAHRKTIAKYEQHADADADEQQVAMLAQTTLPILRKHLEMAESLGKG